ncbi:MAG: hypothetical protein ACI9OO_001864 [Bacteroidia bacterium]|jgi:hypothetical protein
MAQLGLVVDDPRKRAWLENQLVKAPHYVSLSCDAEGLQRVHGDLEEPPEIWLLLLPAHRMEQALNYIGSVSNAPNIVLDEWPLDDVALLRWQVQLMGKLESAPRACKQAVAGEPEYLWLLGASLGGPDGVTAFWSALPADVRATFIYVQHIEEAFDKALVTQVNRNTNYRAAIFQGEARLEPGQVLIVAPEVRPRFLPLAASSPQVEAGRVNTGPASMMWRWTLRSSIDTSWV